MVKEGVAPARAAVGHAIVARQRSTTLSARHQVENRWNMRSQRYLRADCELRRQLPSFAVTSFDQVHDRLSDLAHLSSPVARAFADAGFSLYAVGGSVRDAILGEERGDDFEIDFTTNARPDDIVALMTPLCIVAVGAGPGLWDDRRDAARQRHQGGGHDVPLRGVRGPFAQTRRRVGRLARGRSQSTRLHDQRARPRRRRPGRRDTGRADPLRLLRRIQRPARSGTAHADRSRDPLQ